MFTRRPSSAFVCLAAGAFLLSCGDRSGPPTAVAESSAGTGALHSMHDAGGVATQSLEPFTFRAPLDPYRIHQLPEFMVHSKARTEIVIQRLVFAPGAGAWHTHPGPSFVYVIEGRIKLERFTKKDGCFETPLFGPGNAYFEVGDEVHRAVVEGTESAVVLVTRFNIPVGGAITIPAADPGC